METDSWWSKEKSYKWAKPPHFHDHYHQGFFQKGRGQVQFLHTLKEAGERQDWNNQKGVFRPSVWSRPVALLNRVYRGGGKLLRVWVEPGHKRQRELHGQLLNRKVMELSGPNSPSSKRSDAGRVAGEKSYELVPFLLLSGHPLSSLWDARSSLGGPLV